MSIVSALILETDTTLLTVPSSKRYAITTVIVCNYAPTADTANDSFFDMHLVKGSGGVKSDVNKILNNVSLPAQDTFTFSAERILLDEGDRVILISTDPDKISATVSYLEV
jgi:hypothetical protein